jgi:archaemetzincin
VDGEVLKMLEKRLAFLPFDITILEGAENPKEGYDPERKRFNANPFMDIVKNQPGDRVLGVTEVDLYSENLNFIFGKAQIMGKAAVISLHQLKGNKELYHMRAFKEAVHELGHTMGLDHCKKKSCVMHFSDTIADTDFKNPEYCRLCMKKL